MIRNHLLLALFGILACFLAGALGNEGIIGGKLAKIDQFRYQVSIQVPGYGHGCGGSIIDDQFVITAAHCVIRNDGNFHGDHLTVLAGTDDLQKPGKPAKNVEVQKIYVPAEYDAKDPDKTADIAVLKLNQSLRLLFRRKLQKVKLPSDNHETFSDKTAKISGFGWNKIEIEDNGSENGSNNDGRLRYAEADVLKNKECQHIYRDQRKITNKYICARVHQEANSEAHGVCAGDSGGPLVYDGKYLIGILSAGPFACTEKSKAAIYTRVSHYLNFVRDAMKDKTSNAIRTLTLIG